MSPSDQDSGVRRFDGRVLVFDYGTAKIRCGGTADNPWFVAQDVCDVLGISNSSQALSRLDDDEKGVTTIDTLGGKQRAAIVYESGLYALIFTSRKEVAKTFRKWITSDVLPSLRKTGVYRLAKRQEYLQRGLAPEWIERREQTVVIRKGFTDTLHDHGITEGREYAFCTNAVYYPVLNGSAASVKQRLGLPKDANLRDNLPLKELMMVGLTEQIAKEKIEGEDRQGFQPCREACAIAGNSVANAVKQTLLSGPQQ